MPERFGVQPQDRFAGQPYLAHTASVRASRKKLRPPVPLFCGARDADFLVRRAALRPDACASLARVAPPEGALGRRYDLVDLCDTGLPCTVILDQTAEVVEDKAQPAEEPDQRALHHGTNVLDVIIAAHLKGAADQPYRDVAKHPAIFWVSTALPELLRDRKPGKFRGARM